MTLGADGHRPCRRAGGVPWPLIGGVRVRDQRDVVPLDQRPLPRRPDAGVGGGAADHEVTDAERVELLAQCRVREGVEVLLRDDGLAVAPAAPPRRSASRLAPGVNRSASCWTQSTGAPAALARSMSRRMRSITSSRCHAPAVLAFWTSMTRRALVRCPGSRGRHGPTLEAEPDSFRPDGENGCPDIPGGAKRPVLIRRAAAVLLDPACACRSCTLGSRS